MVLAALLLLAAPPLPACELLTAAEIAAVQGDAPKELRPSERQDAEIVTQHCLFELPLFAQSVSLEVRRPAPGASPKVLAARWRRMLEPPAGEEREHDEERRGPRRISGVGKQALWLGEAHAGALYVLTRRAILRISVGGKGDQTAKLDACKALALRALQRLGSMGGKQ